MVAITMRVAVVVMVGMVVPAVLAAMAAAAAAAMTVQAVVPAARVLNGQQRAQAVVEEGQETQVIQQMSVVSEGAMGVEVVAVEQEALEVQELLS